MHLLYNFVSYNDLWKCMFILYQKFICVYSEEIAHPADFSCGFIVLFK